MHYLEVALITGCAAILFGIAPGGRLLDGLCELEDRFRGSLYGLQLKPVRRMVKLNRGGRLKGQIWFAVAGVALMLFALLGYLAS
jgi:hypothetical protein